MDKFDQSREIALYIDRLRTYRNITLEDFLFDIVSIRQYRRYMSGDSTLSFVILDQLSKRLGFDAEILIMELQTEKARQADQIKNIYNTVISKNLVKAKELMQEVNEEHILSESDRLLFDCSKIFYDLYSGKITQLDTISKTKALVELDKLLLKKALSTSELLILVSFLSFEEYKEKNLIAEKLALYTKNNITIVSGHNIRVLTLVLKELSRYYSFLDNFEKMQYYAEEGIKYSISMRSFYLLDTLFYFAVASSHELGQFDKRDEYIINTMGILIAEGIKPKIEHYVGLFKRNFNVDYKKLLQNI